MNTINHQELMDIYSFINFAQPGTMICDTFNFINSTQETALLIKENPAKLRIIPRRPVHIEFRTGLVRFPDMYLVPLLIQVDYNPGLTYETWLNYHQSGDVKRIFQLLTVQDYIHIFFYHQSIEPACGFYRKQSTIRIPDAYSVFTEFHPLDGPGFLPG